MAFSKNARETGRCLSAVVCRFERDSAGPGSGVPHIQALRLDLMILSSDALGALFSLTVAERNILTARLQAKLRSSPCYNGKGCLPAQKGVVRSCQQGQAACTYLLDCAQANR